MQGKDRKQKGRVPEFKADPAAVVLKIDGREYKYGELKDYVEIVLGERPYSDNEVMERLEELAVDISVYDRAISEMPDLARTPHVQQKVLQAKRKVYPQLFFREEIGKKVKVTVEDVFRSLPEEPPAYDLSIVVCNEKETLDRARSALDGGEAFESVAKRFSDGLTAERGGKLGLKRESETDIFTKEEFAKVASVKEGGTTEPIRMRIGWAIVRVNKKYGSDELRRMKAEGNFDQYRVDAEQKAFKKLLDDIEARSKIVENKEVIGSIEKHIQTDGRMPDAMKTEAMVTVNGVPIYAMEIDSLSPFHSIDVFNTYLKRRIKDELVIQETERLGLGKEHEGILRIAEMRAVTRRFFAVKTREIPVTGKELRDYYDANPGKFRTEEMRDLAVIELRDRKKAKEAAGKARKKEDFEALAVAYNVNEEVKKVKGRLGVVTKNQIMPDVAGKVFSGKVRAGDIVGPIGVKAKDGTDAFVVVKVIAIRKSEAIPYEKVNRDVLTDKVVSRKMEAFLGDFFEGVRRSRKIEFIPLEGGGGR